MEKVKSFEEKEGKKRGGKKRGEENGPFSDAKNTNL
jgi:hypothetical protein